MARKLKKSKQIILSASAIGTLKFCAYSFYNKYILGVRKKDDTDPRRIGNSWHESLDILSMEPGAPCKFCAKESKNDPDCYLCGGSGFVEDIYESLANMLDIRYSPRSPLGAEKRRIERAIILHAALAYQYHYKEKQDYEVIATELPFRIPLVDPRTRNAVPGVFIDGMIDKLIRLPDGRLAIIEHKSTSSDLSNDSSYWGHLKLDTQISLYLYAIQRLQADGILSGLKINPDDPPIMDILFDVWRKPQIKPKKLSVADTATFINTGEYFGAKFNVSISTTKFVVDGEEIPFERNKPKKDQKLGDPVISETPEMFGARLFDTIIEDADRYFCRKELSRTPEEIEKFEEELFSVYQTIELMSDYDTWFHNERSCEATYKCEFIEHCYAGRELDPKNPPVGYECIFSK